jgi:hypothetical protein
MASGLFSGDEDISTIPLSTNLAIDKQPISVASAATRFQGNND